jgi:hypothetical protein
MRDWAGDIWDRFMKSFIVVPTNIGWKKGKNGPGANVMGAGVAQQAAERVSGLAPLYGEFCSRFGASTETTVDLSTGLVLFPTKPLADNPAMSWKGKSTLAQVEKSARELADMGRWMTKEKLLKEHDEDMRKFFGETAEDNDIYVPLVGCGNGGLDEGDVVPMLKSILSDDRFILVQYRPF